MYFLQHGSGYLCCAAPFEGTAVDHHSGSKLCDLRNFSTLARSAFVGERRPSECACRLQSLHRGCRDARTNRAFDTSMEHQFFAALISAEKSASESRKRI